MAEQKNYEESLHYNGEASVRFYPGMHGYFVTDEKLGLKNKRTGGGTTLTGTLAKGQGLMLWPMWEMNKYLKKFLETTTIKDLIDKEDLTVEAILKAGRDAHTQKSDRGKSVGTDAHSWVEAWSRAKMASQETGETFVEPEVPTVDDIAKILRASYIRIINDLKPKELDDYKRLPSLFAKEIEMQEAIWTEATMVRQSIVAAKAWLDLHEVYVHGTEDTVYSRKLFVCGKYDGDWTVSCTKKCNWCYTNAAEGTVGFKNKDFTGRYVVDFKSTNASQDSPKGIYPEYLAQCAVYETALIEEFPDRKYDGYLILNGSKVPFVDKKTGQEYPQFNSHFSFNNEQHRRWAAILAENRELIFAANKEMKESNAGIKVPAKSTDQGS